MEDTVLPGKPCCIQFTPASTALLEPSNVWLAFVMICQPPNPEPAIPTTSPTFGEGGRVTINRDTALRAI
jgi:hypothetical protein